jgi:hypothetical protein
MRQLFGGLLLALGILIAGLSGLCTLLIVGTSLVDGSSGGEDYGIGMMALVIGGVPFVVGLGMFFAGRALLRSPSPPPLTPAAPLDAATMARPREDPPEQ